MTLRLTVLWLLFTAAQPAARAAWPTWAPQFGDARNAAEWTAISYTNTSAQYGKFKAVPPPGSHAALTCTMWARFNTTNALAANTFRTSGAVWCPEPVRRSGPDITAGAFGYPSGTNLETSASMEYSFTPAPGNRPASVFPRGAYTIAGWSSNAVTLTLGGNDITLGPGEFNRNALPGVSDGIILTGSGPVAVGVSGPLRPHQFFQAIDGVVDGGTFAFTPDSTISNELVFLSYRLRLDASNHLYRADMYKLGYAGQIGQTQTNALPDDPAVRSLSSDGLYFFGLDGLSAPDGAWSIDVFDARLHTRWLTDADLDRIYRNGADEAARRQIPQWR
jgi:hypothetical protein